MPTHPENPQNTRHWQAIKHLEHLTRIDLKAKIQTLDDFKGSYDAVEQIDEVIAILQEAARKIEEVAASMDATL